jgi:hypothetical protein
VNAKAAAIVWLGFMALAGCAHEVAKNATSGAVQEVAKGQQATSEDPTKQITRVAAERAVAGAIAALDAPDNQRKLRDAVNAVVNEAIATAFKTATEAPPGQEKAGAAGGESGSPLGKLIGQLVRTSVENAVRDLDAALGQQGNGPLAVSLTNTGKQLTASVMDSAFVKLGETFPECRGPGAFDCIDRKITEMSRSAAAGFSKGVRQTIGWQLLVVAGLVGLGIGLFASWLWSRRSHERDRRVLRTRTT